jgi:hypothetical protein
MRQILFNNSIGTQYHITPDDAAEVINLRNIPTASDAPNPCLDLEKELN